MTDYTLATLPNDAPKEAAALARRLADKDRLGPDVMEMILMTMSTEETSAELLRELEAVGLGVEEEDDGEGCDDDAEEPGEDEGDEPAEPEASE